MFSASKYTEPPLQVMEYGCWRTETRKIMDQVRVLLPLLIDIICFKGPALETVDL